MSSILSFPERGPWGGARYRGNCSGHVYRALFAMLQPRSFCDPMVGSGTSVEVARELGILAHGLDLRMGFNALRHSILATIGGEPVDACISHVPYGPMIVYSGEVWGTQAHPDDLSRCADDEDFHEKLQVVLLNQRAAARPGGHYGTIIGDRRQGGRYVSYQAEAIARMPSDELAAVLLKAQHNVRSDARAYRGMALPRITHEYILLWRRRETTVFGVLRGLAAGAHQRLRSTWRAIVHLCLMQLGGQAELATLYEAVRGAAANRCEANPHWQAKVRQVLNRSEHWFESPGRGVWRLKDA